MSFSVWRVLQGCMDNYNPNYHNRLIAKQLVEEQTRAGKPLSESAVEQMAKSRWLRQFIIELKKAAHSGGAMIQPIMYGKQTDMQEAEERLAGMAGLRVVKIPFEVP